LYLQARYKIAPTHHIHVSVKFNFVGAHWFCSKVIMSPVISDQLTPVFSLCSAKRLCALGGEKQVKPIIHKEVKRRCAFRARA